MNDILQWSLIIGFVVLYSCLISWLLKQSFDE